MKYFRLAGTWLGVILLTHASAWAQDSIRYTDRKTQREAPPATGTIQEETPSMVVYKPGTAAGTREIPAQDIIDITYEVPASIRLTYRTAAAEEKKSADPTAKDADRKE